MAKGFRIRIKGKYALFSRPELKVERFSYDVPTPSALRGLIESVYFHPGLQIKIDKIQILNEIKRISIRRNELNSKISASKVHSSIKKKKPIYMDRREDIAQRNSSILTDVDYIVDFHFEIGDDVNPGDTEEKFAAIIGRRLDKGQTYKQPYLGCREFPAEVERVDLNETFDSYYDGSGIRDLGLMLYDIDYSNPESLQPVFYHPVMKDGVIEVKDCEVYR